MASLPPCPRCGRPDDEHTFAEFTYCLYADEGMTPEAAEAVVERVYERLEGK